MREVNLYNFDTIDKMQRFPWRQKDKNEDKASYYAVCPACENPIQLIGLFKRESNTPRPYGKHTGKRIPGFPYFDPEEYEFCPYFDPNKNKNRANTKRKKAQYHGSQNHSTSPRQL